MAASSRRRRFLCLHTGVVSAILESVFFLDDDRVVPRERVEVVDVDPPAEDGAGGTRLLTSTREVAGKRRRSAWDRLVKPLRGDMALHAAFERDWRTWVWCGIIAAIFVPVYCVLMYFYIAHPAPPPYPYRYEGPTAVLLIMLLMDVMELAFPSTLQSPRYLIALGGVAHLALFLTYAPRFFGIVYEFKTAVGSVDLMRTLSWATSQPLFQAMVGVHAKMEARFVFSMGAITLVLLVLGAVERYLWGLASSLVTVAIFVLGTAETVGSVILILRAAHVHRADMSYSRTVFISMCYVLFLFGPLPVFVLDVRGLVPHYAWLATATSADIVSATFLLLLLRGSSYLEQTMARARREAVLDLLAREKMSFFRLLRDQVSEPIASASTAASQLAEITFRLWASSDAGGGRSSRSGGPPRRPGGGGGRRLRRRHPEAGTGAAAGAGAGGAAGTGAGAAGDQVSKAEDEGWESLADSTAESADDESAGEESSSRVSDDDLALGASPAGGGGGGGGGGVARGSRSRPSPSRGSRSGAAAASDVPWPAALRESHSRAADLSTQLLGTVGTISKSFNDVLLYQMIVDNQLSLSPVILSVDTLIRDQRRMLRALLVERGIRLSTRVARGKGEVQLVRCDPRVVSYLVGTLLVQAARSCRRGGRLIVYMRVVDHEVPVLARELVTREGAYIPAGETEAVAAVTAGQPSEPLRLDSDTDADSISGADDDESGRDPSGDESRSRWVRMGLHAPRDVVVRRVVTGTRLQLVVADSGPAADADTITHVFTSPLPPRNVARRWVDPYRHVMHGRNGTPLELFNCRWLAFLSGGRLFATNVAAMLARSESKSRSWASSVGDSRHPISRVSRSDSPPGSSSDPRIATWPPQPSTTARSAAPTTRSGGASTGTAPTVDPDADIAHAAALAGTNYAVLLELPLSPAPIAPTHHSPVPESPRHDDSHSSSSARVRPTSINDVTVSADTLSGTLA